jgi:transposase InsO family protein
VSWFYNWVHREPTPTEVRRSELDAAVKAAFEASKRTYGSPRIHADLVEAGWTVSENTVADSMRRQGLQGRKPKRRKGTTKQDKTAPKFPDRLKRDFTAPEANVKWCGDMTKIPTDEGKLYLATVLDLFSRKLLASPTAEHPDAELAGDAIKMAAAVRGGRTVIDGVIFHTDRGSTYTAKDFTKLCRRLGVVQSMGRVGSCFDNAASEAFFSTLEHEVLSRHHFRTRAEARAVVSPLVPGLLQRQTTAQLGGVAGSGRVRENRCHPAGRSLNEASTISGETHGRVFHGAQYAYPATRPSSVAVRNGNPAPVMACMRRCHSVASGAVSSNVATPVSTWWA